MIINCLVARDNFLWQFLSLSDGSAARISWRDCTQQEEAKNLKSISVRAGKSPGVENDKFHIRRDHYH
jgi:hypothetical protein